VHGIPIVNYKQGLAHFICKIKIRQLNFNLSQKTSKKMILQPQNANLVHLVTAEVDTHAPLLPAK